MSVKCPEPSCTFRGSDWKDVQRHSYAIHRLPCCPCHMCGGTLYSSIKDHHVDYHDSNSECFFCGIRFDSHRQMMTHVRNDHSKMIGLSKPIVPFINQNPDVNLITKMKKYYKGPIAKIIQKGEDYLLMYDEKENRVIFGFTSLTPAKLDKFQDRERPSRWVHDEVTPNYLVTEEAIRYYGMDCGHLISAKDMSYSAKAFNSSFSILNASPMTQNINNGNWRALENHNRKLTKSCNELCFFSIPIYNQTNSSFPGPGAISVHIPKAFGKISFIENVNEETKTQAFVLQNHYCRYRSGFLNGNTSHQDFATATGLLFQLFPHTWDVSGNETDHISQRCDFKGCLRTFSTRYEMTTHSRCHTTQHKCCNCEQTFPTEDTLKEHQVTNASDLQCSSCLFVAENNLFLGLHNQTHNLDASYVKGIQEKTITKPTKTTMFACVMRKCGFKNQSWLTVQKHAAEIHSQFSCNPCHKCGRRLLSGITRHHTGHHAAVLPCWVCSKLVKGYMSLQIHIKTRHKAEIGWTEPIVPFINQNPDVNLITKMKKYYKGPITKIIQKGEDYLLMYDEKENRVIFGFTSLTPAKLNKLQSRERLRTWVHDDIPPNYLVTKEAIKYHGMDCGHLISAKDMSYSDEAYGSSFCILNAAPMTRNLNCGQWKSLETHNRLIGKAYQELNYFSIPIYDALAKPKLSPGGVYLHIPKAFGKISYLEKPNQPLTCQACITANKFDGTLQSFLHYKSSHHDFENSTGLHFIKVPMSWDKDCKIKNNTELRCVFNGCKETFQTQCSFKAHQETHAAKTSCWVCDQVFSTSEQLSQHYQLNHKSTKCTKCSYIAKNITSLREHELTHYDEYPHPCTFTDCHARFMRSKDLTVHLRIHTGERPFKCSFVGCKKAFKHRNALVGHVRIHTGERPYKCSFEGCSKGFMTSSALAEHVKFHTGARPFKCSFEGCGKEFMRSPDLKVHFRIHTGERPYKCSFEGCGKGCVSSSALTAHMETHMTEKKFNCTECPYSSSRKINLQRHRERMHPDEQLAEIPAKRYKTK